MKKQLKTLHTIIGAERFILTGSTALAHHGLITMDKAKDLDIVLVNPTAGGTEVLERLQADKPNKKFKKLGELCYSFFFEEVKVDVWVVTSHDTPTLILSEGIEIASISHIVWQKKKANRPKDWIQLMQFAKSIFDQHTFNNIINEINTSTSDDYTEED